MTREKSLFHKKLPTHAKSEESQSLTWTFEVGDSSADPRSAEVKPRRQDIVFKIRKLESNQYQLIVIQTPRGHYEYLYLECFYIMNQLETATGRFVSLQEEPRSAWDIDFKVRHADDPLIFG